MNRLIGLALISVSLAFGQGAQEAAALQGYLGLSDTQVSSLRQIRESARNEAKPLRDAMQTKARQLREYQRNGTGDAATLGQLMVDLREGRKQLQPLRTRAHDQAMAVLTPEQRTKLAQLESAAKSRRELRQAARLGLVTGAERQPRRARGRV